MAKRTVLEKHNIECPECGIVTEHEAGTPFPAADTMVCKSCGRNQARAVLERVMGKQYLDLKKLSRWILVVTIPSLVVLIIGIYILMNPGSAGISRNVTVFLVVFSGILLALGLSFAGTLKWRQQMLERLAKEKNLNLIYPE